MNITQEKEYLYSMMKEITQERRRLTDMYYGLKERLDFLHQQEQKGLEELSLKGYTDLHNQIQKEIAVTNIKRESDFLVEKIESYNIEEIEKPIIPQEIIEEEKRVVKRRKGKVSKEKIASIMVEVLKEEGIPLKLQNLMEKMIEKLETDFSKSSFQNKVIPYVMEKYSRIEKVGRGYYQYR